MESWLLFISFHHNLGMLLGNWVLCGRMAFYTVCGLHTAATDSWYMLVMLAWCFVVASWAWQIWMVLFKFRFFTWGDLQCQHPHKIATFCKLVVWVICVNSLEQKLQVFIRSQRDNKKLVKNTTGHWVCLWKFLYSTESFTWLSIYFLMVAVIVMTSFMLLFDNPRF